MRRGAIPFGLDRAAYAMQSLSAALETREMLQEFFGELAHWDRLSLILKLHPGPADQRLLWHGLVADWVKASSSYAPLGPARRSELRGLLESRKTEVNLECFRAIDDALERH